MPTLSQKRNNRLARVIKNLVHRRMRSLYLSHVTKDMSKKDTTPRGPFMSSYEVPEHMQFDHKGYQKDVNFFLEVEDNSDFSLSPEKKDGKTEAEDLALLEEIQAREDLKEELEIAKKKFIYKLDKIRGIIGFRFNLEHLLEDELDTEMLEAIALHREAKERVKFQLKIQAEGEDLESQIEEQHKMKQELVHKYESIFQNANKKINDMKQELKQQVYSNETKINDLVKSMDKFNHDTAEKGRKSVSSKIDLLFKLKQNTMNNTK